jgi:hypothetical protein
MKRLLLIVFLFNCLYSVQVKAQLFGFYSKGYIITTNNDTINGYIEVKDYYNYMKFKYKLAENDRWPKRISTEYISQFGVMFKTYDRVNDGFNSHLMERIIKGKISLYKYVYKTYLMGGGGMNGVTYSTSITGEDLYLVKDNKTYVLNKKNFNELLKKMMEDNENFYVEIDKLEFKDGFFELNLQNLLTRYNFASLRK